MMAAQRGWSVEETANKLLEVSTKAQERVRLRDVESVDSCESPSPSRGLYSCGGRQLAYGS